AAASGRLRRRGFGVHTAEGVAGRDVRQHCGGGPRIMRGLWIMAGVTFREAARRKILWTALLLGVGFLGVFALGMRIQMADSIQRGVPALLRYEILDGMLMIG